MSKLVRYIGAKEASETLCAHCGVYPATLLYDVCHEDIWVEDIGWCAACAMIASTAGLISEVEKLP